MENMILRKIGTIRINGDDIRLELDKRYAIALIGLDGFSHINILWWFSDCDNERDRGCLKENSPYKNAPDELGTFVTRSPFRPNPIALSCSEITYIDHQNAIIGLTYIDANDGTPILDIKPYTPSLDRVEHPSIPEWCAHWPKSLEKSGDFDWGNVFNF